MNKVEEFEKLYQCYWFPDVGKGCMIVDEDAEYLVNLFYGINENARYEYRLGFRSKIYGDRRESSIEYDGDAWCTTGSLRLARGLKDDLCLPSRSGQIRLDGDDVLFHLHPSTKMIVPNFNSLVVSGDHAERVRRILGLGN